MGLFCLLRNYGERERRFGILRLTLQPSGVIRPLFLSFPGNQTNGLEFCSGGNFDSESYCFSTP